jgi:hypothetical protein
VRTISVNLESAIREVRNASNCTPRHTGRCWHGRAGSAGWVHVAFSQRTRWGEERGVAQGMGGTEWTRGDSTSRCCQRGGAHRPYCAGEPHG